MTSEEHLNEEERLILNFLALEGTSPIYYLDRFTVEKRVYEGKTPANISKDIDEDPEASDITHFGPVMTDALNNLLRKGYTETDLSTGLYVALTERGRKVI